MDNIKKVAILMATYNGERYLKEQIDSIMDQSFQEWELFIRDDASKDRTTRIIHEYMEKESRIHLVETESDMHGACVNFYALLRYAKENLQDFDYFFLSDQDDIWEATKIEEEVHEIESRYSSDPKILVYSDLLLMDENGRCNGGKMSDIHNINLTNPPDIYFNQIFVWGNTVAFTKELLEIINIPNSITNALSHDHYLAFYSVAYGETIYLDRALVKYRRHLDNLSGLPPRYNFFMIASKIKHGIKPIIQSHYRDYSNVLYFLENAPFMNTLLRDILMAYKNGGIYALKIISKYHIVPGSNTYNVFLNKFILLTKIYQAKCFREGKNDR